MKFFLVTFAVLHQTLALDSLPSFALNQERSFDGSPSVSITFPDGYSDTMVLSRYYANEEEKLARSEECHFIGHLLGEPDACVAMTGCPGTDDLEFTIMSEHSSKQALFKWLKEGGVELIESPLKHAKHEARSFDREDVPEDWTDMEDDDEILNPEEEAKEFKAAAMTSGSVQASNVLTIQAGYDDSFLQKTGGHSEAKTYIKTIMPHVQALYCHKSSLGTVVKIELKSDIKHVPGRNLAASGEMLQSMFDTTKNIIGDADLVAYMAYDPPCQPPCSYTAGIAYTGVVCLHPVNNHYKQSINEWAKTHAATAHTVAHEMGHNLGMKHDFDSPHKENGCDKTGVMSYGDPVNKWSTCSASDFKNHYLANKNSWCMPMASNACGNVVTPTTTTTTQAPMSCYQAWAYYNQCDQSKNPWWCKMDGHQCCYCSTGCTCKSTMG